ncbi:MAG: hypothetical protein SGCHY_004521 [Lobulomycetales sp.]
MQHFNKNLWDHCIPTFKESQETFCGTAMYLWWALPVLATSVLAAYSESLDITAHASSVALHWTFRSSHVLVGKPHELAGVPVSPTGVQLLAWMKRDPEKDWKGLVNALSGIFCASLNFMDDSVSADASLSLHENSTRFFRYASLPREIVCTENLTPWDKLLPCGSNAGLASLFNAYKLFDSNYHSMGIRITTEPELSIQQTLTIVTDPVRLHKSRDWSLEKLFDRQIHKLCPVANPTTATLRVIGPAPGSFVLPEQPMELVRLGDAAAEATYMLNSSFTGSKIGVSWPNVKDDISSYITLPPSSLPKFSVKRYTTGFGQERGGLAIDLYNRHATPKRFRLYQVVPWYLKFYLHTLKINSTTAAEYVSFVDSGTSSWSANPTDVVIDTYYQPTIARGRPTVLEMEVHLPVGKTSLHIDFEKSFIRYTEHPPDANRGFDMGPLVATRVEDGHVFYSTNLLMNMPTPDFSMPYNVITLSCTVIAMLYASVFNLTVRKYDCISTEK